MFRDVIKSAVYRNWMCCFPFVPRTLVNLAFFQNLRIPKLSLMMNKSLTPQCCSGMMQKLRDTIVTWMPRNVVRKWLATLTLIRTWVDSRRSADIDASLGPMVLILRWRRVVRDSRLPNLLSLPEDRRSYHDKLASFAVACCFALACL